jgi:hypothetical protein
MTTSASHDRFHESESSLYKVTLPSPVVLLPPHSRVNQPGRSYVYVSVPFSSPLVQQPNAGQGYLSLEVSRSHTMTHHSRKTTLDKGSAHRREQYLTTHNTQRERHPSSGGIQTRNPSRRSAANPDLRTALPLEPAAYPSALTKRNGIAVRALWLLLPTKITHCRKTRRLYALFSDVISRLHYLT